VRLHVVSDVHGATEALARAGDGADAFLCLGDLVLFVDYEDHGRGIFADLFGRDHTERFIALRTDGRFDEAREYGAALWRTVEGERREVLDAAVRRQYAELFAAMPSPAYLTYGNVDVPRLWDEAVRDGQHTLDGAAVDIDGVRVGFVGGGLHSAMRTPHEVSEEEFAAKLEAVGEVDILCTHIPPATPELTYDVVARRFERGSAALVRTIERTQPRLVLFGHVHQPLSQRARIGRTECVNVGHFRSTRRPYVVEW
jgi:Icc-related predicted phosphoesterase